MTEKYTFISPPENTSWGIDGENGKIVDTEKYTCISCMWKKTSHTKGITSKTC